MPETPLSNKFWYMMFFSKPRSDILYLSVELLKNYMYLHTGCQGVHYDLSALCPGLINYYSMPITITITYYYYYYYYYYYCLLLHIFKQPITIAITVTGNVCGVGCLKKNFFLMARWPIFHICPLTKDVHM